MRLFSALVILAVFTKFVRGVNTTSSVFVATNEWQEIPPGFAIPSGLHVRLNLQTGKREAKFLDESGENNSDHAIAINPEHDRSLQGENLNEQKILLSDALKSIQSERLHLKFSAEELSQIKREYRAKEEHSISHDKKLHPFQLDSEVISFLINDFLNITHLESIQEITAAESMRRKISILDNFEPLLHQIDNSIQFSISLGGLDLLLPIVANESFPLRVKAIRLLGVLTQNNPQVQAKVFNSNFGTYLLKLMISSSSCEELSTTVFAFGSLVRDFPLAQKVLLSSSGIQTLIAIIEKECEIKVKLKAVNLILDVLGEHREISSTTGQHADADDFGQFYKKSELVDGLHSYGFCTAVASIVIQDILEFLKQPDLTDDYIMAIKSSRDICSHFWANNAELKFAFITLENNLMLDSDEYCREVAEKVSETIKLLNTSVHGEL